jgi:hypothetical protein
MRHRRGALPGASPFSGRGVLQPDSSARARAGASRDKMPRSSRGAERLHFVPGPEAFSVSALTALRCRSGPSRPKPCGETPNDFRPAPAERRALRPPFFMPEVPTAPEPIRRRRGNPSRATRPTDACRALTAHNIFFFLLPAALSAGPPRNAPWTARITGVRTAGREAACGVRAYARKHSARGMLQIRIVQRLILRFTFGRQSGGAHAERRTSCVLYDRASCRMPAPPTRLPGSFAPVDPDQRGDGPPCWVPPGAALCGVIA